MANPEHLERLKTADWNGWRQTHPGTTPDLTDTKLEGLDLSGRNLAGADLSRTKIEGCKLDGASLGRAAVHGMMVKATTFDRADLSECDFEYQKLEEMSFVGAVLRKVSFKSASIKGSNFIDSTRGGRSKILLGNHLGTRSRRQGELSLIDRLID